VKLDAKPDASDRAGNIDEKKVPSWRKLVTGETTPPVVIAVDKHGNVHELVERKLALEAARQNDNDQYLSVGSRGRSVQDEDAKAKRKAENDKIKERIKVSTAILAELVMECEKGEPVPVRDDVLLALRPMAIRHAASAGCLLFCKRRGIDRGDNVYKAAEAEMDKVDTGALWGMIIELLVAQEWSGCHSAFSSLVYPGIAQPFLDLYGIDVKAVEKRVKEEGKKVSRKAAKGEEPGKKTPIAAPVKQVVSKTVTLAEAEAFNRACSLVIKWDLDLNEIADFAFDSVGECKTPDILVLMGIGAVGEEENGETASVYVARSPQGWHNGHSLDVDEENAVYCAEFLPSIKETAFATKNMALKFALKDIRSNLIMHGGSNAVDYVLEQYIEQMEEVISQAPPAVEEPRPTAEEIDPKHVEWAKGMLRDFPDLSVTEIVDSCDVTEKLAERLLVLARCELPPVEDRYLKMTGKPWYENREAVCPVCLISRRTPVADGGMLVICNCGGKGHVVGAMPLEEAKPAKRAGKGKKGGAK